MISSSVCVRGRIIATSDSAHSQGHGILSYWTMFQVLDYDTNLHVVPVVFHHFVGTECMDSWKNVFEASKYVLAFDVFGRVTIVHEEKISTERKKQS